jgi:hypothetical protein
MINQTTILILSLTVWLSTFAQGNPIRGTRTHRNSYRTRYKRRRTTINELENNDGGKTGGKGKSTKYGGVKGEAMPKYKKGTKGEDVDFNGVQTNAPTKQPSHVPNSDLSVLSPSTKTAKTSKKVKKNKSNDSHKNSSKLSKKSKRSSSKAPGEFLF